VIRVVVDVGEEAEDLLVGLKAEGADQGGHGDLALAVDLDGEDVLVGGLDLQPGAPVGNQLGGEEGPAGDPVLGVGEVDARRAHQLGDNHALGAVDDEGPLLGHDREVAHEDLGLLDLARLLDGQPGIDPQRRRVGHVAGATLFLVELGLAEGIVEEAELVVLAGVVGDGVDLVEELLEALALEPLEGVELGLDQVANGQHLGDAAVGVAGGGG
jgi:hypothetical protein